MESGIEAYKRKQGCSRNPDALVSRDVFSAPASQFSLKQMLHTLRGLQQAAEEEAEVLFMLQTQATAAGLTRWSPEEGAGSQVDSTEGADGAAEKGREEEEDALVRMMRDNPS